jgi:hypothetical protein
MRIIFSPPPSSRWRSGDPVVRLQSRVRPISLPTLVALALGVHAGCDTNTTPARPPPASAALPTRVAVPATEPARSNHIARVADSENKPDPLIGFWLHGLWTTPETPPGDRFPIGLIMQPGGADRPLLETFATAPIVAGFRSRREGRAIAERLADVQHQKVTWYRASYDGDWEFSPAPLPPDESPHPSPAPPVGDHNDTLERCHKLFILPPPLGDRGVALAVQGHGKAYELMASYPRDLSTILYVSWEEMAANPPRTLSDECALNEEPIEGSRFRVFYLDGCNEWGAIQHRILWKGREQLRESVNRESPPQSTCTPPQTPAGSK